MRPLANPTESVPLPNLAPATARPNQLGNILAISSLVIKELYRRKDFYVLFILTALLTVVMGSATFFSIENVSRYLQEICLFLIWISSLVIAVVTTARQIPAERENRTLFPLLAKPVTRNDVVLGKFAGCWLATGLALLVFYFFFGLISGLREHHWPVGNHLQALVLHWFMLGIVCAMTVLGSVVLAAPSSTNTIVLVLTAGILLVGRHLNKVALGLDEPGQTIVYWIYYLLPHLELFDLRDLIIHEWGLVRWPIFGGALAYAAVYITL
ncbi:MAG TPA: ABC transporter permease subunit, partial [Verrucomicrobiae bacterium]|nr:ABC transporter permease subunit [Verrucomicrobiae bacterium]